MTVGQISGQSTQTLCVIDTYADILVFVVHASLVDVAQGQETEHLLVRADGLLDGMAVGVEHQVVVGEDYAFGSAGGA